MTNAERRYRIPADRQADVLRLHYTGSSDRQVYLALYPAGGPPGSPKLGTFADALHELIRETEDSVRALALREGVPHFSPARVPSDAECAEIALGGRVGEAPLSPGDEEALADLDAGRGALCRVLRDLTDPDSPPPDPPPPEAGRWVDPAAERGKVAALLGNALSANVAVRLRGAATRIARTVTLHNLRLARKEEADAEDEGKAAGAADPSQPDLSGRPAPARGLVPSGVGERGTPGAATGGFVLDLSAKA